MHSDKFANPLHPATKAHKALTGKRKKTDDDHEAIAKSHRPVKIVEESGLVPAGVVSENGKNRTLRPGERT